MPEGLSYEHAVSHRLYLLSGAGGIAYFITDKTGNLLYGERFSPEQWTSVLNGSFRPNPDIFGLVFSKTELISTDNHFILIPETYAINNRIELFKLSYEADLTNSIIRHAGTSFGAEICYEQPASTYGFLKEKLPGLELWQEAGILLDWLVKWPQEPETKHIFLYLNDTALMLFAFNRQHELILCNQFSYNTLDDLQYIVLFVLEQLAFKGEHTRLVLLGQNMTWEAFHELIDPYFREVILEKGNNSNQREITPAFSEMINRYLPLKIRLYL